MEEEYRTSSKFHRYINTVDRIIPGAPPTTQCRDDLGLHDFDRAMEFFSIGLSQYFMVDRLIINTRVMRTTSGYASYTDKRHHGISTDMLARKWGIGLEKAYQ